MIKYRKNNEIKTIKLFVIIMIFYSLFEEFYIGPSLGKTLTWLIIYLLGMLITTKKIYIGKYGKPIFAMICAILLQMLFTSIIRGADLIEIVYSNRWMFYLLIYFVLIDYIKTEKEWNSIIVIFTLFSLILSLLIIYQGYLRSFRGNIWILNQAAQNIVTNSLSAWRFGRVRLPLCSGLRMLSYTYSFTSVVVTKQTPNKVLHVINMIVTGTSFFLFDGSRMTLLILIAISAFSFFYGLYQKHKSVRLILKALALVVGVVLLYIVLRTVMDYKFLLRMLGVSVQEGSWYARLGAYKYFLEMALNPPIVGIGMLSETSTKNAFSLLHGPNGIFYASDVGVIGTLAITGWVVTGIYIYIIFKNIKMSKRKGKEKYWTVSNSVNVLLITTLITLSMLTRGMLSMFPICLVISEFDESFSSGQNSLNPIKTTESKLP